MIGILGEIFKAAAHIGCGERRFCRLIQGIGIATIGVDPTKAFIERARQLDPRGDYRIARAEALGINDGIIDLAVCYLSLIDIPDLGAAISEVHRILRPGGAFLIVNLQSFNSAGLIMEWRKSGILV